MIRKDFDKVEAEGVMSPSKSYISEEQMLELWNTRGLKFRVDELHQVLLDRGLTPNIDQPKFRETIYGLLFHFLVEGGARRDPKRTPKQKFPKVY